MSEWKGILHAFERVMQRLGELEVLIRELPQRPTTDPGLALRERAANLELELRAANNELAEMSRNYGRAVRRVSELEDGYGAELTHLRERVPNLEKQLNQQHADLLQAERKEQEATDAGRSAHKAFVEMQAIANELRNRVADLSRSTKWPATDEDLAKLYAPKSGFEEFRTSTLEGLRRIYDLGVRDGAKRKISAERLTELAVIAYNAREDASIESFASEDIEEAWEFTVGEVLEAVGLEIE